MHPVPEACTRFPFPLVTSCYRSVYMLREQDASFGITLQFAMLGAHITTHLDNQSIGDEGEQACNRASSARVGWLWAYSIESRMTPAGAPPMLLFMLNFRACAIRDPLPAERGIADAAPPRASKRCRSAPSPSLRSRCLIAEVWSVVRPQDTLSTSFHTYLLACLPPCLSFLLVLSLARSLNVKDGHGCGCDRNRALEWGGIAK